MQTNQYLFDFYNNYDEDAAPPLSCVAFFVKVLKRFCWGGRAAERGTLPVLNQLKPRMKGQPA